MCNIDDIAKLDEFRDYFKTYGPIIFSALKNDKKTLNQRGYGGVAANMAKDMGWAITRCLTSGVASSCVHTDAMCTCAG